MRPLKLAHDVIEKLGEVLADIVRKSMLTEEVPQAWRDANVVYPSTRREIEHTIISLKCIVCKVMERIINIDYYGEPRGMRRDETKVSRNRDSTLQICCCFLKRFW